MTEWETVLKKAREGEYSHAYMISAPAHAGRAAAEALIAAADAAEVLRISDEKEIKIDSVRQVGELLGNAPGGLRVIFIDEAHKMNDRSQNYLLKQLEEPPKEVMFILTTSAKKRLLPTILSRVTEVRPEQERRSKVRSALSKEDKWAAAWSGGHIEDARALAADEAFLDARGRAMQAAAMISGRTSALETSRLIAEAKRMEDALAVLTEIFVDALRIKSGAESIYSGEEAVKAASVFTTKSLGCIIDILERGMQKKESCPAINKRLLAESILFDILEVKKCQRS